MCTSAPLHTCIHKFFYISRGLVHSSLSYKDYINTILIKVCRTLYGIMRAPKGASKQAKRTANFSVCLSFLEYTSEAWILHLRYLVKDRESKKRKAFRWACHFRIRPHHICYVKFQLVNFGRST